ncbi:16213_t:CDS:2, partial [Gigaspora margarita]
ENVSEQQPFEARTVQKNNILVLFINKISLTELKKSNYTLEHKFENKLVKLLNENRLVANIIACK